MKRSFAVMCLVCILAGFIFTAETKATTNVPVVEVYKSRIELGTIPEDVTDFVGPVIISNKGTADLKILNVTGSCSCFKGYEGDEDIKPGKQGVINVIYDKTKIPAGKVARTTLIKTKGELKTRGVILVKLII